MYAIASMPEPLVPNMHIDPPHKFTYSAKLSSTLLNKREYFSFQKPEFQVAEPIILLVFFELFEYISWILVFHQPHVCFYPGFAWEYCFGSFGSVAGTVSANVACGAKHDLLPASHIRWPVELSDSQILKGFSFIEGDLGHGLFFRCGGWHDAAVETFDGHAAGGIPQGAQKADHAPVGVMRIGPIIMKFFMSVSLMLQKIFGQVFQGRETN